MSLDFAIFGTSPLARLLAGFLAEQHGKSVCLVGDAWSPLLLPRRLDAAMMVATRPETWTQLHAAGTETGKFLNGLGRGLVEHIDVLLVAETHASTEAIAHMRTSAGGCGYALERVADRTLAEPGAAWVLRGIPALVRDKADSAIEHWLDQIGLRRIAPAEHDIAIRRDGVVKIRGGGIELEAARAILADDAALLAWLDESVRERLLRTVPARTLLTEPARAIAAPMVRYLDRGVSLAQRGKSGITVLVTGAEAILERVGSTLTLQAPLRSAADVSHLHLETQDGGPLVATANGPKVSILAGFGEAAAFFAPALARHYAEASTESEASYFAARDTGRGNARKQIADFIAEPA